MSRYWGAAIPGLAMTAAELPAVDGLLRLENPEIGSGAVLRSAYTLEDVAEVHLQTLRANFSAPDSVVLIGMSMGAMIASILAAEHRAELPARTEFRFVSASANSAENPAAPDALLEDWRAAVPGDESAFRKLLTPFFSDAFRAAYPDRFEEYVRYRARGGNGQTAKAFRRQTAALRAFDGAKYWPKVAASEALFVSGEADRVFGPAHVRELRMLLPGALYREIPAFGHMLNLEAPEWWNKL